MTHHRTVFFSGVLLALAHCAPRDEVGLVNADAGEISDGSADVDPTRGDAPSAEDAPPGSIDDGGCPGPCPVCPAGYGCVTHSSFGVGVVPICLKSCTSSADCTLEEWCLGIGAPTDGGTEQRRYCVAESPPPTCRPLNSYAHCDWNAYSCDGNLRVNFVARRGAWCGMRYEYCPNGCTVGWFDAGTNGYTTAYCR